MEALEKASTAPDLWDDPERARGQMQRLADGKRQIETWRGLEARLDDAAALLELAQEADDAESLREVGGEAAGVAADLAALEFELSFSGPYDDRDAILAIHAGAGGTESQDWAAMLQRMYLRWFERHGFDATVVDLAEGEEAGIKSATIEVRGRLAYGWLRSERGVHRLVRISPFDLTHSRHTSFALVEVMPEVVGAAEITIQLGRSARRHLPGQRARRPERAEERHRRADHPQAQRHRGDVPERALAGAQPRIGDEGAGGAPAGAGAACGRRRSGRNSRGST